ncbi:unnamed protein product, partial [Symbiodinium natans]
MFPFFVLLLVAASSHRVREDAEATLVASPSDQSYKENASSQALPQKGEKCYCYDVAWNKQSNCCEEGLVCDKESWTCKTALGSKWSGRRNVPVLTPTVDESSCAANRTHMVSHSAALSPATMPTMNSTATTLMRNAAANAGRSVFTVTSTTGIVTMLSASEQTGPSKPHRSLATRIRKEMSKRGVGHAGPVEISIGRNETTLLVQALASWGQAALDQVMDSSEELQSLASPGAADAALAALATEFGRLARQVMEHSRTIWGLKQLTLELAEVYPNIQSQLPVYRFQTRFYGRHFDVLERLLDGLEKQKGHPDAEIRMAELGVACGPMGLHLLARFPQLRYFGADPTIKEEVREAYAPYAARADLHATTSEEMHAALLDEEPMDIVFIDGPHTYANVRNDLHLWEKRVKKGGIIAGHDFTVRHPPLLWAVSEYRMTN